MPTVTVFTPSWNRAYIIRNLYESLRRQTVYDFEWLVVDDGSEDETPALFEEIQKEALPFPVRYHRRENGGKYRAVNTGIELAAGKLFFIVDSDDWLTPSAIESLIRWEASIAGKEGFAGISGNSGTPQKQLIGTTFDGEYIDASNLERRRRKIMGDKAEAYYTAILRQYKFVEYEGEKFVSEDALWNRIAEEGYRIRWFNEIIYLCEYLADGYTKNLDRIQGENMVSFAAAVKEQLGYQRMSGIEKLRRVYGFIRIANKQGITAGDGAKRIGIPKILYALLKLPVALYARIRNS